MPTMVERWPRGLIDPPECPVCGSKERDLESVACWHCQQGHYADCQWNRNVAQRLPSLNSDEKRTWERLTRLLPPDEVVLRLGKRRGR